jgi:hypothetical protein
MSGKEGAERIDMGSHSLSSGLFPAGLLTYQPVSLSQYALGSFIPYHVYDNHVMYKSRLCVCKEYEIQLGPGKAS